MRFWKRKKKLPPEIDAIFQKMTNAVFPGGDQQIQAEVSEIISLLDHNVSQDRAKDLLIHAKGRAFLALHSANDINEALQTCIDSVYYRSQGRLDRAMAEKIAEFVLQQLVEQLQNSSQQVS